MRRSDAKQVRRRLACTVLRVTASLRDVERRLNVTFAAAQKFEAGIAELEPKAESDLGAHLELDGMRAQLDDLRAEAKTLSELATWYKAGFEQLTQMTRELDTYISWYDTVEG